MFYDRLNALCKDNNMSVSVFVRDVLHLSSSSATGWKKGASPSSDIVLKIAKYFNVSTDYLLGISDIPTQYSYISEFEDLAEKVDVSLYGHSRKERAEEMLKLLASICKPADEKRPEIQMTTEQKDPQINHLNSIYTNNLAATEAEMIADVLKKVPTKARPQVVSAVCGLIDAICSISEAIYQRNVSHDTSKQKE